MMNPIVSVLFLTAVVCQTTGQAQVTLDVSQQNSYYQLDVRVKKFVDLAIIKANQQLSFGHLNFYAIGKDYDQVSSRVRIDVRLKNTKCRKATGANEHRHRPECAFKQLEVWCMVCSPDPNTSDPFIDCVRRKDAKTHYDIWDANCMAQPLRLPGEDSMVTSPGMNSGSGEVENDNATGTSFNVTADQENVMSFNGTADQENVMRMNISDYEYNDYEDGGYDIGDTSY